MYFFTYKTTNKINNKVYYGRHSSEETKKRISASHMGMKKAWVTNAHKKGTKHSEETKKKMAEARARFLTLREQNAS